MHAIAACPQPAGLGNPVCVVGIPLAQEDNPQERKWQGCFVPFFRKVTKLNVINKPFHCFFSVTTDKIVNLYRLGVPFPQDSQQIFSCNSIPLWPHPCPKSHADSRKRPGPRSGLKPSGQFTQGEIDFLLYTEQLPREPQGPVARLQSVAPAQAACVYRLPCPNDLLQPRLPVDL